MTVMLHPSGDETYIRLCYTMTDRDTDKETDFDYRVPLVTTPCHLGGVRWWLVCPLTRNGVHCGRRVGVLYRAPWADHYGCRHCYDLSYESRNESRHGRFACMGHYLTLDRQRERLMEQMSRWTYRGQPTRQARRLHVLDTRLAAYGRAHYSDLV